MFSIISVYNNREILEKYLLASLERQTASFEKLMVDNTTNRYGSAASALNAGAADAKGTYLVFVHQDIEFRSDDWLKTAGERLAQFPNLGIAGVAGCKGDHQGVYSNLMHGVPPSKGAPLAVSGVQKAQTLDECLLIIPRQVWQETKFDAETCDSWHLYGVDYCLTVARKGRDVVILPDEVYHLSPGSSYRADQYFPSLKRLATKHRRWVTTLHATTGDWNLKHLNAQLAAQKSKRLLKRLFPQLATFWRRLVPRA